MNEGQSVIPHFRLFRMHTLPNCSFVTTEQSGLVILILSYLSEAFTICLYDVDAYPKGDDALRLNSEYAEQQNADLASLKKHAVHMKQTTLLWIVRLMLYKKASNRELQQALQRDNGRRRQRMIFTGAVVAPAATPNVVQDILNHEE
jgi:hypothetical protein